MEKIVAVLVLALIFQGCADLDNTLGIENIDNSCIEVSYVSGICGQAVLKIETPAYQHLGEKVDGVEHVFSTVFSCEDDAKSKEGKFFITIIDKDINGDCARCLAMMVYNGKKRYSVKRVDACK